MFEYNLPPEKIAQSPVTPPDECKLLIYNRASNKIIDTIFKNLPDYLDESYALVFNTTRVQPVRIECEFENGKNTNFLIYRIINNREAYILTKLSKKTFPVILYKDKKKLGTIVGKSEFGFRLILDEDVDNVVNKYGVMPLPPYIKRKPDSNDYIWYQPLFARNGFSIASPTASLHFTRRVIEELKLKMVEFVFLRLDVSFSTIYERERLPDELGNEYYEISYEQYEKLKALKKMGKKIIAVGTTVCKALETISRNGVLQGYSHLFIKPSFEFKLTDGIITNFHMSKSPTLSLICAYLGIETTKRLYDYALLNDYRFLSYGDAMLIY